MKESPEALRKNQILMEFTDDDMNPRIHRAIDKIYELEEYKNAMEFYFGRSRCFEALEQYQNEKR